MGLTPGQYFLYVSRLEPENNASMVVEAFQQVEASFADLKLVLVGDAPYADAYKRHLHALTCRDDRIVMPGAIYGDGYHLLHRHALAYIHATSVGGTHPALIEGMAHGNIILAYKTAENVEAVGDGALLFTDATSLANLLVRVADNPTAFLEYRMAAAKRAGSVYSWARVIDQYEDLFESIARFREPRYRFDVGQSESRAHVVSGGKPRHE
jgi:glycosyltransferase involved in cell wall biosynthesis